MNEKDNTRIIRRCVSVKSMIMYVYMNVSVNQRQHRAPKKNYKKEQKERKFH